MKESNIPAGNTENSFQERERLLDIIGMLIKANNKKNTVLFYQEIVGCGNTCSLFYEEKHGKKRNFR